MSFKHFTVFAAVSILGQRYCTKVRLLRLAGILWTLPNIDMARDKKKETFMYGLSNIYVDGGGGIFTKTKAKT